MRRSNTSSVVAKSFILLPAASIREAARHRDGGCRLSLSSSSDGVQVTHIGAEELEEILEELDNDPNTGYVVIDVRGYDEVANTGKLSPHAQTLPLPLLATRGALDMNEDDFEIEFGFPKPMPDDTIVFTCAAGIRSVQACRLAALSGYTNLVNYKGGAHDWFRVPNRGT